MYFNTSKTISLEVLLHLCRVLGILPLGEARDSKQFNNPETVILKRQRDEEKEGR